MKNMALRSGRRFSYRLKCTGSGTSVNNVGSIRKTSINRGDGSARLVSSRRAGYLRRRNID